MNFLQLLVKTLSTVLLNKFLDLFRRSVVQSCDVFCLLCNFSLQRRSGDYEGLINNREIRSSFLVNWVVVPFVEEIVDVAPNVLFAILPCSWFLLVKMTCTFRSLHRKRGAITVHVKRVSTSNFIRDVGVIDVSCRNWFERFVFVRAGKR